MLDDTAHKNAAAGKKGVIYREYYPQDTEGGL